MSNGVDQPVDNGRMVLKLIGVVVGMFAFGFALVPLYDIICDVTGLNGKTGDTAYTVTGDEVVDETRTITVQFLANNNDGMPWEFRPVVRTMKVHPGQMYETEFYARNVTLSAMTGQAVPSVAPFHAAQYFHKTECFCFEQQLLAEGEDLDMPLRFIIDPALPKHVNKLTLSYTLYDISDQVTPELAANN